MRTTLSLALCMILTAGVLGPSTGCTSSTSTVPSPVARLTADEKALTRVNTAVHLAVINKQITPQQLKPLVKLSDDAQNAVFEAGKLDPVTDPVARAQAEVDFQTAFKKYKAAVPAGILPPETPGVNP